MALNWKHGAPKRVFISGGGSGIGREMAHRLAKEGADVAIFNRKLAPAVVVEMQGFAVRPAQRFASYSTDVADAAGLKAAIDQAVAELGKPDLVINSAGIQDAKVFEEQTGAEFDRVIAVNLGGSRNFAAATLPHLSAGGHIVFIASLAAIVGSFAYTAYCASKFAVRGLAEALRVEMKLRNIDVSICCPGEVLTPMVEMEKQNQHPISEAMKAFAGYQTVEVSCEQMLQGIARRKFEIIDGFKPKFTAVLARYLPGLMMNVADSIALKAKRKMETQ
jgi:NAD(P)-dependent dehydrogenase (short-subunit alcohol dehydrogenase family)